MPSLFETVCKEGKSHGHPLLMQAERLVQKHNELGFVKYGSVKVGVAISREGDIVPSKATRISKGSYAHELAVRAFEDLVKQAETLREIHEIDDDECCELAWWEGYTGSQTRYNPKHPDAAEPKPVSGELKVRPQMPEEVILPFPSVRLPCRAVLKIG